MAETVEVWPDTWQPVSVFCDLRTQWRVGIAGATGLDYSAIPIVFRLRGIPKVEWPSMFDDLKVLESEALEEMRSA